jgi:hypothetical protein
VQEVCRCWDHRGGTEERLQPWPEKTGPVVGFKNCKKIKKPTLHSLKILISEDGATVLSPTSPVLGLKPLSSCHWNV